MKNASRRFMKSAGDGQDTDSHLKAVLPEGDKTALTTSRASAIRLKGSARAPSTTGEECFFTNLKAQSPTNPRWRKG